MAVKTTLLVHGEVSRVSKTVYPPNDKRKEEYVKTEVLIVGEQCICSASLGRNVAEPKKGDIVFALVEVDTFNNDDSVSLVEYLDLATVFPRPTAAPAAPAKVA